MGKVTSFVIVIKKNYAYMYNITNLMFHIKGFNYASNQINFCMQDCVISFFFFNLNISEVVTLLM